LYGTWIVALCRLEDFPTLPSFFEVSDAEALDLLTCIEQEERLRELTDRLQSRAPTQKEATLTKTISDNHFRENNNTVIIDIDELDNIILRRNTSSTCITAGSLEKAVLGHFIPLVIQKDSAAVSPWLILNRIVLPDIDERTIIQKHRNAACQKLRSVLLTLNRDIKESLGDPPDGERWLVSAKCKGLSLNNSLSWAVSPKVRKLYRRPRTRTINKNPKNLEATQPSRGQKTQARAVSHRKRANYKDDD
jgi:hypothetical protein